MRNKIKALARRSKTAIVLFKIFDNYRLKRRATSGAIETIHGSTHLQTTVEDSLRYIEKLFNDYLTYATLQPHDIVGKRILELGPGDNLGVALRFLAAGADSVVCLDRFYSKRNPDHEKEIYTALRASLVAAERQHFDEAISLDGEIELNPQRLRSIYGDTIEGLADKFDGDDRPFDLIVSCAVLEEIYDLNPAFAAMDRLLTPGGCFIHMIDLGDYGMFRNQGMHPLTFLTISESIYKRMASDSGLPNRKRLGYYVEKMREFGYQSEFFVTSVIPTGRLEPATEYIPGSFKCDSSRSLVDEIRSRLATEFKSIDEEELLIDGVLLVARKPL